MAIVKENEVFDELRKLFNLPDSCVRVDIHLAVGEFVTVDCEYYPIKGNGMTINRKFNLVPADDEDDVEVETPGGTITSRINSGRLPQ